MLRVVKIFASLVVLGVLANCRLGVGSSGLELQNKGIVADITYNSQGVCHRKTIDMKINSGGERNAISVDFAFLGNCGDGAKIFTRVPPDWPVRAIKSVFMSIDSNWNEIYEAVLQHPKISDGCTQADLNFSTSANSIRKVYTPFPRELRKYDFVYEIIIVAPSCVSESSSDIQILLTPNFEVGDIGIRVA